MRSSEAVFRPVGANLQFSAGEMTAAAVALEKQMPVKTIPLIANGSIQGDHPSTLGILHCNLLQLLVLCCFSVLDFGIDKVGFVLDLVLIA